LLDGGNSKRLKIHMKKVKMMWINIQNCTFGTALKSTKFLLSAKEVKLKFLFENIGCR
jgi:hypothetical protein